MNIDFWYVLLWIGLAQGLFLFTALTLLKGKRKKAQRALMGLVFCFSSLIVIQLFRYTAAESHIMNLLYYGGGIPFLIGPLFLAYTDSLVSKNGMTGKELIGHLLPFILTTVLLITTDFYGVLSSPIFGALKFVHTLIYYVVCLNMLARKKRSKDDISRSLLIKLIWTQLVALVIIYLVVASEDYFVQTRIEADLISSLIFTFFFFAFAFVIFLYPHQTLPEANFTVQYSGSNLRDAQKQELTSKLEELLTHHKIYLDPNLNLRYLADSLGASVHHVSQVINEFYQMNYNQLINHYRIEEVKKNILDEKRSLLGIALDAGFQSKSAFNRIFKQQEGVTPSDYKKSISK